MEDREDGFLLGVALEKLKECTVRAWRGGGAILEQKDRDKSD